MSGGSLSGKPLTVSSLVAGSIAVTGGGGFGLTPSPGMGVVGSEVAITVNPSTFQMVGNKCFLSVATGVVVTITPDASLKSAIPFWQQYPIDGAALTVNLSNVGGTLVLQINGPPGGPPQTIAICYL